MSRIRIGIVGYGNLGKSVELGCYQNKDMEIVGVFSRRDPKTIKTRKEGVPVYHLDEVKNMVDDIDVMILCGGSAKDIPTQGPMLAAMFNTVDAFDTHAKIPEYFDQMDKVAKESGKVAVVASGWDPGMFSINRLYAEAILPEGSTYTFWGKGVSQGHSDAIRRVDGVKKAVQYTIPIEDAIKAIKSGENPELSTREKHLRECYVVAHEGASKEQIEKDIVTMPNYFADYDTTVHFISEEEFDANHQGLPHGGLVIRNGKTGLNNEHNQIIEYNLKLESNPDFTASVLLAYARAAYKMNKEGIKGAKTVVDIAPVYLSMRTAEEIRREMI
ncbi:MAG: diaminopimelate dehydrogenase [Clostridiales bacterium]|nr:diaminopimelate dehydrogenase [Clostridiales bacterium]